MKFRRLLIRLIGSFLMTGISVHLYAQPLPHLLSKLPNGTYTKKDFTIVQGDTIFKKYEKYAFEFSNGDTILLIESYSIKSDWTLSRYIARGDDEEQVGWQQKFDLKGNITFEQFCDTSTGDCNRQVQYSYYPNGNLMARVCFYKHKYDGSSFFYYNDGSFKYHLEYKNGLLWNAHATYDQQGNITDQGDFCDGTGTLNVYAANGVLLKQRIYVRGKLKRTIQIAK
ncbi:MAG TPA: hypothetical protein PLT99_15335 [Chitinophagales bacterium]|nr:hypothetical protein [Chitinophagales bacterium]HNE47526.1 hypothetical protein [Chitinophagales bacterium]HNJ90853.1 hypothetical protein [Chitinophagales bacterium]HNM30940.1 hypothetical protein [Chitinophagales bacterium]HNO30129.1 hypothetical protein [Chitinophagales bacterium]